MKKTLAICCSRERPERMKETLKSMRETHTEPLDILLVVENDKHLSSYKKIEGVKFLVSERDPKIKGAAPLWNMAFNLFPNYDYYVLVADDNIFRTKGWDKRMREKIDKQNGWAVVHVNDLHKRGSLLSFFMTSGKLIKAVGFISIPGLIHLKVDVLWQKIGGSIGKIFYLDDVIIEHVHPAFGKAEWDDLYRSINSDEVIYNDNDVYDKWIKEEFPILVKSIKEQIS